MIYISTGQFNLGFEESVKKINFAKIKNIELSCGKYVKDPVPKIIKLSKKYNLLIHNYFPRPKKDFVINLSSNNKIIKKRSYDHIKKNISLTAKIGAKFLSFHAGFLFDPDYTHLGQTFDSQKIQSRSDAINSFIHNVNKLSKYAERKKVNLLIENNGENYKFSGSAFKQKKDRSFHHGTLLINANIEKLNDYLFAKDKRIEAKGIKSVRSNVENLSNLFINVSRVGFRIS